MNTWKPILAALVIFAAGVVTGGLTVNLRKQPAHSKGTVAVKKPVAMPRELRELSRRMQAELDLTPEQRERIEAIIHDSQERVKTLRDEIGQKEFREMRQKIRSELTPEQRKKFAEIMQRHDERNKRDERTGRPSPPPAEKTE
ncbi:MAG: hypothetical protein DME22_08980 [Verrucomicrobia bacterium]|nr:MAG: hypothetical protein DME22_08980 [Verrucomicrobiota bacterium]